MANWTSLTVKNAITKIRDAEIVLPVIQRRLVWTEDKMELLFDSLLKGNSFGSVICIEEEKDTKPLFAFREFSKDGHNVDSSEITELPKTLWFIIDGQQRLQSFYIGLIGSLEGKRLFFDLYSDYSEDEFDFKFSDKADSLPKCNKERTSSSIQNCFWYPVDNLFTKLNDTNDDDQISAEIIDKFSIEDAIQIKSIEKNIRCFYKGVFNIESIGISRVSINKAKNAVENRQRIVELFRRLNDGGTKLSAYDLVASLFKGFDYKMENFLDTVVSENADIGITQDILIKLLLVLNDKPTKDMVDLTATDAEFATNNFERVQKTLSVLKMFLKLNSNYQWFSASKNRSAIPLYFLAYHIFYSPVETAELTHMFDKFETNDKNYVNMTYWLRISILNRVFSRGCGWIPYKTGIKKLHAIMQTNKGKTFPMQSLISVYKNHPLYFYDKITADNINLLDYEYVFYLIYNGQTSMRSEDIDHIHPKSLLLASGVDESLVNNIGNYQLLDSGTNRGEKNGKELALWINDYVASDNKSEYLHRHLIPNDEKLWKTEAYAEFLTKRTDMIVSKINENLI